MNKRTGKEEGKMNKNEEKEVWVNLTKELWTGKEEGKMNKNEEKEVWVNNKGTKDWERRREDG